MELRELAEQIVFGTTLEAKLQRATNLTDLHPGSAIESPREPHRPSALRFKTSDQPSPGFPSTDELDDERTRGRLLHFFANHELLATELMALVLLRFPDAPPEFRRGVAQTLADEQAHTRLYLERMRECGVTFGELPVSGYFWRSIASMQSPTDFVAGLSLTFEQANLDYCRQFARCFSEAGDPRTARVLEGIYRDEIGHVAHGLKWFRRWKPEGQSDWEAYCHQLRFPLSPQRAKGTVWNPEGRRAAGLNADFIAALHVFSQSKGRTPSVFHFNPFTEGVLAYGPHFTPKRALAALARDLATLPQFLARQDDVVLVPRRPSVRFLSRLKEAGFALPEFQEHNGPTLPSDHPLRERKLGALRPWAWGPDSRRLFEPLLGASHQGNGSPLPVTNKTSDALYSKGWSAELLRELLRSAGKPVDGLCEAEEVGVEVKTMDEALCAISAIRRRGHHRILLKEAFGLAGNNALRLWEPDILEGQLRWLSRALENGRTLIVEPWLERVCDFSIQAEMQPGRLRVLGFTGLLNDPTGQYRGNWAEPNWTRHPPSRVLAELGRSGLEPRAVLDIYAALWPLLSARLEQAGYQGPVGIDAFVYQLPDGQRRLKPVVEVNPRFTMGRVTAELMRSVQPGCFGLFRIVRVSEVRKAGFANVEAYVAYREAKNPLMLAGEPSPRLKSGWIALTEASRAETVLATWQVASSLPELDLGGPSTQAPPLRGEAL